MLTGIRVLDLTHLVAGAYATHRLSELGADVIKVELPPAGDGIRTIPPQIDGLSAYHLALDTNKRSLGLDFRSDKGRDILIELAKRADVVMTLGSSSRARIGIPDETLQLANPQLVCCNISGFGDSGPYKDLPSHGANIDAAAGLLEMSRDDHSTTRLPDYRFFVATQAGGMSAASAVLAALVERQRTGRGRSLDISCWDAALTFNYIGITWGAYTGELWGGLGSFGPRYDAFETADGKYVMMAPLEKKFWVKLCEAVGRADLAQRGTWETALDFGDGDNELPGILAEIARSRTRAEWTSLAATKRLPVTPVLSAVELVNDSHVAARNMLVTITHPLTGQPVQVVAGGLGSSAAAVTRRPPPAFGEHTAVVLRELLAYDSYDIRRLAADEIVVLHGTA